MRIRLLTSLSLCALASSTFALEALGTWSDINWPNGWYVRPVHISLLPDERLLIWNTNYSFGQPLPDTPYGTAVSPGTNYAYDVFTVGNASNSTTNLFCAGHTMLWDGRLFNAGGHLIENGYGDDRVNVFDYRLPNNQAWTTSGRRMTQLRWYPTTTALPNRRILILTGIGGSKHTTADLPDLWMVGVPWLTGLADYHHAFPPNGNMDNYYPHMFIDPKDGNPFFAARGWADEGPSPNQKLDLVKLAWSTYSTFPNGSMNVRGYYPSSVMINAKNWSGVRESIIVKSGGAESSGEHEPAVTNALFADLYQDPPTWQAAAGMNLGRLNHTMVALPTTDVIVFGGSLTFGTNGIPVPEEAKPRTAPELWKPFVSDRATRPWKLFNKPTPADHEIPRGYHSTATLLPDGRVAVGGGEPDGADKGSGNENTRDVQLFSPPYGGTDAWQSLRPTIGVNCPTVIRYGETFDVTVSPNVTSGRPISKLMLISLGSTTHAFNENQQVVELDFQNLGNNVLRVMPPTAPKIATPTFYMLFAMDNTDLGPQGETRIIGIPSLSKMVHLKDFEPVYPSGGALTKGTAQQGINWAQPYSLLLGDNQYLGQRIDFGPGFTGSTAEFVVSGIAPVTDPTKVRVHIESKTGGIADLTIFLFNWLTNAYESVSGPSVSNQTEKIYEIVVANTTGKYVRADGSVKAKFAYIQRGPTFVWPLSARVDVVEFGVR
ncbi:MAG: galactose oxidase-like domain-containing protein [Fimbriimonadales bacterium]